MNFSLANSRGYDTENHSMTGLWIEVSERILERERKEDELAELIKKDAERATARRKNRHNNTKKEPDGE